MKDRHQLGTAFAARSAQARPYCDAQGQHCQLCVAACTQKVASEYVAAVQVVQSNIGGFLFALGAYCAPPGTPQTVPRAELFAIIVLVFLAHEGACLSVVADSDPPG